jgi:D-amino-acid oxidase
VKWGKQFDTFCIDPAIYLPYLKIRCISQGIHFKRATLVHISEAVDLHHPHPQRAALIVNCSGVMASKLGGVEDDQLIPVKGQLVLVRNESHGMFSMSGEEGVPSGEYCYIMSRPFGMSSIG